MVEHGGMGFLLKKKLNWTPKYNFYSMLDEMVDYWLDYYKIKINE